jgi:hypothetical protein
MVVFGPGDRAVLVQSVSAGLHKDSVPVTDGDVPAIGSSVAVAWNQSSGS